MHGQRELVKRQGLLFFLNQAKPRLPDSVCCIWRVLAASSAMASCLLGCSPSAHEFSLHLISLPSRNSIQDIALDVARGNVDAGSLQTAPRSQRAAHHAHQLRSDRCGWLLRCRRSCEARKPFHLCLDRAHERHANTSLLPARSTRYPRLR
jgi:hypothetical protein